MILTKPATMTQAHPWNLPLPLTRPTENNDCLRLFTNRKGDRDMSEDLQARFQKASEEVTQLSEAPDNMMKLQLYALFKQGTEGDVQSKRPGMMDMVNRYKWDAWKTHEGKSQDQAMEEYIALVEELKAADAAK